MRTLTGSAADGSIRATWDGRTTKNVAVPNGAYTWKLTSTGMDGVGSTSQTGTLTIT